MLLVITITKGGYIDTLPKIQRPVMIHRIGNEKPDNAITRVGGQKYDDNSRP